MTALYQINPRKLPMTKREQFLGGPVVDKYFAIATVAGIVGAGYLGVHMWLMLHGSLPFWHNYMQMKELHATFQIYGFLGMFVMGFALQASPKLFGVPQMSIPRCRSMLPLIGTVLGLVSWAAGFVLPGRLLFSLSFIVFAVLLLPVVRSGTVENRIGVGFPLFVSVFVFILGAWSDFSSPAEATWILWGAAGGAIFSAGQQFLTGFFEAKRLSLTSAIVFAVLFLSALVTLYGAAHCPVHKETQLTVAALLVIGALIYFLLSTGAFRVFGAMKRDPLAFAFSAGIIWLLVGAVMLLNGHSYLDLALHSWVIGWVMTLIMAVSIRVIGYLAGGPLLSVQKQLCLLAVFQIVPFLRGPVHRAVPGGDWIVISVTSLVLAIWSFVLLKGVGQIWLRQFQLGQGEQAVQC